MVSLIIGQLMNTVKSSPWNKEIQQVDRAMLPSEAAWAETLILQHLLPHTLSKQTHSISLIIFSIFAQSAIYMYKRRGIYTCYYI